MVLSQVVEKRKLAPLYVGLSFIGLPRTNPFYFVPSQKTLAAAVNLRLLAHDLSKTNPVTEQRLFKLAQKLGRTANRVYNGTHADGIHLANFQTILEHAPPNKRKLYTKIVDEIRGLLPDSKGRLRPGFDLKEDGRGTAFSKVENYFWHLLEVKNYFSNEDNYATSTKAPRPRCIVARNLRHVLFMARLLTPFEDWFYANSDHKLSMSENETELRCMFKGMNSSDAGKLLHQKWSRFSNPVALCGDCSSFDGHVSKAALRATHEFYKCMVPQVRGIKAYQDCFKAQLDNNISSRLGVKFTCEGRRMSGDRDTAFGNTLLTVLMVNLALSGQFPFELACDGDDFVVITEAEHSLAANTLLKQTYTDLGHELDFDVVTKTFEHIDFCQKKPILTGSGYKLVRNPLKVFSNTTASTRNYESPASRRKLFASIGLGDYYCSADVPVLGEYARMIYRMATGKEIVQTDLSHERIAELKSTLHPSDPLFQRLVNERHLPLLGEVTHEARFSFAQAYGMPVVEQYRWEAFFRSQSEYNFDQQPAIFDHEVTEIYE